MTLRRRAPARVLTVLIFAIAACAEEPREPGTGEPSGGEPGSPARAAGVEGLALEADVAVMESFPVQLRGTLRVENPTGAPAGAGEVDLAVPR